MASKGDHFSGVASAYARFRPHYPSALFDYLTSLVPSRHLAWDAGTGNGQAAAALAEHFSRVVATDVSAAQIAQARPHPRVEYRVAPEAQSGLADGSVDLVTIAQALHWFDLPLFFAEVGRVLRSGGILAVWSYGRFQTDDPASQAVMDRFYYETVGPYWPPERQLVEEGYASVKLPFIEMTPPAFAMEAPLSLEGLTGYVRTWSATQAFERAQGMDPVPEFARALADVWGDPAAARLISWPLALRVSRKA